VTNSDSAQSSALSHTGFDQMRKGLYAAYSMKQPCVYILASKRNGTLYVGVTSDLPQRVWQHKNDQAEGFTKRYGVHKLVWY
jgi:predicted GIY-YIG superfamily endonuclease